MTVGILDTGGANHASIQNAFRRLGVEASVISTARELDLAERIVFPGVGHAGFAMQKLQSLNLITALCELKKPVLGICLGLQMLFETSEEGDAKCLGLLPGRVFQLQSEPGFRVPHMGWNQVKRTGASQLLNGIPDNSYFYFTHSFAVPPNTASVAVTEKPAVVPSVIEFENFFATQFHPEKSGEAGAQILKNFLGLELGQAARAL